MLGEKLFDERVTIVSDPAEKNAESKPFRPEVVLPVQTARRGLKKAC